MGNNSGPIMGPLDVKKGTDRKGTPGLWVTFEPDSAPVFVTNEHWVGVDFDGTLSTDDCPGHFEPPYPLGHPIPQMVAMIRSLQQSGIVVKIFTARACEPHNIPIIQNWTESAGLGRMEVTNLKDYGLIRFFDDRAIQMVPNQGRSVSTRLNS